MIPLLCFWAAAGPLDRIEPEVVAAVARGELPGAVVAVVHQDQVIYRKAIGRRTVVPVEEPMTADTLFDLASLTKPVATATAVMQLVERGLLNLDDPVARHRPAFAAHGKGAITIEHLLRHTSGLIADNPLADYQLGRDEAFRRIDDLKPLAPAGDRFIYSDVNFIVLGELVGSASGKPLDEYCRDHLFAPLGMSDTGFLPAESLRPRIAPTTRVGDRWLRGEVHDPRARALGGVAGHAGLFGTADDLLRFARMLLHGGELDGARVFRAETVERMTRPAAVPGGLRGLGWDVRTGFSGNRGDRFPRDGGFGHTGFTGTSLWIDPASRTAVVFLSSRVHPDGKGNVTRLRGRVAALAAEAVGYAAADVGVLSGIDVLSAERFAALKGRRVGLVTNHTGRDRAGRATIDLLHRADGVELRALFSPEHGIRGALDVSNIGDDTDAATGLPVYSLYGPRRKPAVEQLRGIDTLVYDIQDIGCRFYTYISTLGLVLEAAAENGLRVVVLDRPNPIGGIDVEGPITDPGSESFVAFHSMPLRHGMTVGEVARMLKAERTPAVDLEVIACRGWNRGDWYDRTLLPWVNPSPNMRSLTQALLYPGVGLLETTNVSVGRGTDQPFEWIGAPWIDGRSFADDLAAKRLPGVRFVPTVRVPGSSTHAKQTCDGVQIIVDDWSKFRPVRTGLELAASLRALYPNEWNIEKYDTLLRHQATFEGLKAGRSAAQLEAAWEADLKNFIERRRAFLLYPEPTQ